MSRDAEFRRDPVGRGAGRHRARDAREPADVARRAMRVGGEDGERVGRRDVHIAADNHVAVAVAVGGGAEVGRGRRHHQVEQFLGVGRVRVGVMAAEVGQRRSVDDGSFRRAELALEDGVRIRAGDRVHGVEAHAEARGEQRPHGLEVEQGFHQGEVLRHRIDDLDFGAFEPDRAEAVDVDVGRVRDLVGVDRLAAGEDRVGDLLGRRAARADVVLDAEIAVRAAGVVAGRQDDAAEGAEVTDEGGGGRGRQNSALADHDAAEPVGRRHLGHDLDRLAIEEAAVAAQNQRLAVKALERIEDRLDEILQIVRGLEDGDLLAQTRRAGLLIGEGQRGDGSDHGRFSRCRRLAQARRRTLGRGSSAGNGAAIVSTLMTRNDL